MHAYALDHIPDNTLLADLAALVATDRRTTAALLAHIAEVDARELFLPAACSSMHTYCVRVLRLAEDAAFKRIRAARIARRYPQIFDAIADGRLHLSGVALLAAQLTDANVDDVIRAAAHRTKAEIEVLVARLAPQPDLPDAITPVAPPGAPSFPLPELAPGPVAPPAGNPTPPRVQPLAPERYGLQVTISQETRDKLDRAQALLRHRNPSGDLAEVLDRALDALLAKLEKEKFAATSRPRRAKACKADADPRYVSNAVTRAVHDRDGEQWAFDADVIAALRRLGFKTQETRRAMADTAGQPASTFEERIRVALVYLARMRESRCSEVETSADTAGQHASTFEERIRVALAYLARMRGSRCSEGETSADAAGQPATTYEERTRAALAYFACMPGTRCSEGPAIVLAG